MLRDVALRAPPQHDTFKTYTCHIEEDGAYATSVSKCDMFNFQSIVPYFNAITCTGLACTR
jgi:hypothetical protein